MGAVKDKIAILIAEKTQSLIRKIVPQVISIAEKAGIKNIGTIDEIMPDYCLTDPELKKILNTRNKLIETLNKAYKVIDTLSKPLKILNTAVNTTSSALKKVSAARKVANTALIFVPTAPGAAVATINTLKDIEEFLNPKITTVKNTINSITAALDLAKRALKNLINLLKSIDSYLIGCNISNISSDSLIPLSEELQIIDQTQLTEEMPTNEIYLGFILDIEVVPYSPTVNRRRAVAKNKDGIVLLSTPYSFTTLDEILINELKLIIDSNNLRAD